MDFGSSLSDLLYKELESGAGEPEVVKNKDFVVAKESSKPNNNKSLGTRPKYFARSSQNERPWRGSNSFRPNMSAPMENWRGGWRAKQGRNMDLPDCKTYTSERNEHVSLSGRFSGQQPSKPPNDSNTLKSQELKEETKIQPEEEGIPGFQLSQIKELLNMEPTELLMDLTERLKDLILLLKRNLGPDMTMLVVEMLAKISTSPRKEKQAALLAQAIQPSVLEKFSSHSFDIVAQKQKYSSAELIKYFENLYVLYQDVVNIMPSKASEILSDHSTRAVMAIQNLKAIRKVPVPPKLEKDYEILMTSVESLLEQRKSAAPKESREKIRREWQPGIDFRQLSIHPLPQDLLGNAEVNICPVVVDGPYESVEHYLDVQFKLMREDFLIPLREGIADFIEQKSSKSDKFKPIENVRFYEGVRFLNQFAKDDMVVSRVLFRDTNKTCRHNWKTSKRLMYGSLLCFTSDLFNSIILGIIVDRQVEDLEIGILKCELIGEVEELDLFKKEYIMAENEVYFEAYQHVMRALQNFNDWNFPLQEYIINVSSGSHLPTYLDYYTLCDNEDLLPSQEHLEVNESQYWALCSALTNQCAVIQGPPGTGKTYVGLKIAKLLLENSSRWRKWERSPILVVCFTNHALDQFLEGMLSFTSKIVRLGNQSKNENLMIRNLRDYRGYIRDPEYHEIKNDLKLFTQSISDLNDFSNEFKRNVGILSFNHLSLGMNRRHASWFGKQYDDINSNILEWLLSGTYFQSSFDSCPAIDHTEFISESMKSAYACSLWEMRCYIDQLEKEAFAAEGFEQESIRNIIIMYTSRYHYMKNKLAEHFDPDVKLIRRLSSVTNLNHLHPEHRWILYKYWVSQAFLNNENRIMTLKEQYRILNAKKLEMIKMCNIRTLRVHDVVGMTTTAAARHQTMLQELGCEIVIVEEAAEAMESHIVACLSSKCEHLILIGDHKQLRPSPAVYKLAKDYHLEISLFERLLINGVKYATLRIQHRMRPDIADLIFPAVYPVLENHPTVLAYDNVKGLKKNLYFITHSELEERSGDGSSKKNPHEAEFLIELCRHIILQGYDPSQITILAAYLGQMFLLAEEKEKYSILNDVKVTAVDNYQGEENDFILLSLVRNNEEGRIGFLGSENRTCVALSRAKQGLYIMGNIDMLAEKSRLWSQIRKVLQEKEAVGTHLTLQCLKHPEQLTEVSKAEDFNSVIEGGCSLMCMERLNCGHICMEKCHVPGHKDYRCHEICNRVMCSQEHRCQKSCWETCGDCMVAVESNLPCGHTAETLCHLDPEEYKCTEVVSVNLPDCEHKNEKPCFEDLEDVKCSFPCDSRLPCGHICPMNCHINNDPEHLEFKCMRPCSQKNRQCKDEHTCQRLCSEECGTCTVQVNRKLPNCEHCYDMECSINPSTIVCKNECKRILDCGHGCPKKCVDMCGDCSMIVEKEIPVCKHKMKMKCFEAPVRRMCKENCTRTLGCGHTCTDICGIYCNENDCNVLTNSVSQALCGHDVSLFCYEVNIKVPSPETLMERCKEPCNQILECSHLCKGTCGQCMEGRIHIPCQEKCRRNLICGHQCTVLCSQACPPCMQNCFICCEHSKCKRKCGKSCSHCQEKCGWQCEHHTCNKKCSDLCDRLPCNEPCKEILKCGHECIGYCGEKCPALCRVCDPEAIDDILTFLGTDGDDNARFVLLPDCGHVFESIGLDKWITVNSGLVKMLVCPQCKIPIQQAYRYGRDAKIRLIHIMNVKYKVFGNLKNINKRVIRLGQDISPNLFCDEGFVKSRSSLDELRNFIEQNEKAHFGAFMLNSLEVRTQFVLSILKIFKEHKHKVSSVEDLQKCTKAADSLIRKILSRLDSISMQEHNDFLGECMRFHLMVLSCALKNSEEFRTSERANWYEDYEKCCVVVEGAKLFPKDRYKEIFKELDKIAKKLNTRVIYFCSWYLIKVVSAIDLHQDHWYICPNGHIFVSSKCGEVIHSVRCNECGEEIGGRSYKLHPTI